MGVIGRGLVAGAAGVVVLNAATYADMAVRGRPASEAPARTVEAALQALGVEVGGSKGERAHRLEALGALAGIGVGVGIGVGAALLRAAHLRPGPRLGSVLLGAGAMAAADVPLAKLGVDDPRGWSAGDWAADAWPHLAYGATVHAVLVGLEGRERCRRERRGRRTEASRG